MPDVSVCLYVSVLISRSNVTRLENYKRHSVVKLIPSDAMGPRCYIESSSVRRLIIISITYDVENDLDERFLDAYVDPSQSYL